MNKELLEKGVDMPDSPEENNYKRYLELGGIINENDYNSALTRAKNKTILDEVLIKQAKNIARFAGMELRSIEDPFDPRIILYGILRRDVLPKIDHNQDKIIGPRTSVYHDGVSPNDVNSERVRHHHSQMSDQRIFVEALRMLGDTKSLDKMIKAYPNISFRYQKGSSK